MSTVHVKGISSQTSEKEVRDFFSFCGKITSLSITPRSGDAGSDQSATVTFEKETAAKTALLLDNTQLGPSHVNVTASPGIDQLASGATPTSPTAPGEKEGSELTQEDKPRSRIVAEYLAHGYVLGDKAIDKAIELDNKHGISKRFTTILADFDNRAKITDKARGVNESYGVMDKANQGFQSLNSYFEKAAGTPTGQKVREFYLAGNKRAIDIHNEARRLADLKKAEQSPGASTAPPHAAAAAVPPVAGAGTDAEAPSTTTAPPVTEKTA